MTEINRLSNNFDFLRIFAATMVIFSHVFPLFYGINTNRDPFLPLNFSGISLGYLAVIIFFIISGYLITLSWNRDPVIRNFFVKRILRIYPGYIVVLLVTSFILGVILTNLTIFEYFKNFNYIGFIHNFLELNQVNLPGVFQNNPYPDTVNGSLWILFWEFKMYVLVAILGFFGLLNKKFMIILIITYSLVWYSWDMKLLVLKNNIIVSNLLSNLPVYFFIGGFFALRKGQTYDYRIAIFLFIAWILTLKFFIFVPFSFIALPYIVLAFGNSNIPIISKFGIFGDFSYGLYIYAFPVQQTLISLAGKYLTIPSFFILSVVITLGFAVLSWKLVESKAMTLKKRFIRPH